MQFQWYDRPASETCDLSPRTAGELRTQPLNGGQIVDTEFFNRLHELSPRVPFEAKAATLQKIQIARPSFILAKRV